MTKEYERGKAMALADCAKYGRLVVDLGGKLHKVAKDITDHQKGYTAGVEEWLRNNPEK